MPLNIHVHVHLVDCIHQQEVSVFIFDKKAPEFDKMPKKQREAICEMLKKGPTHLIKLRHPRLLTIEHQVEESK